MQIVITPERALADGVSPDSLISIAQWHDARAGIVEKALASKKQRAFGGPVTFFDQRRHEQMAAEIRKVAAALAALTSFGVAA